MLVVRLNQRIYGPYGLDGLKALRSIVENMLNGIEVKVSEVAVGSRGWTEAFLEGPDADVAVRILEEHIGVLPRTPDELSEGALLKGRVLTLKDDGLYVDVGLENLAVRVPVQTLRGQFLDVFFMDLEKARRAYMLYSEFPVELYVERLYGDTVEARLSWRWLRWVEDTAFSGFSRVYITGLTLRRVKRALGKTRYRPAVLEYRALGVLETLMALDPLVDVERFSLWLRKTLNPLGLEFSEPFESLGELAYAVQDEVGLTASPPFQIR
ncbi:hypothetical protein DRO58_07145 [Candidatus Bathyarchaeota archaeon]|nr:MAG: hypothetical protein DRO58_07145 [Candidatus Bathyarchaeota archaeon]